MKESYTNKQVAEKTGLSPHTLRYYEDFIPAKPPKWKELCIIESLGNISKRTIHDKKTYGNLCSSRR